MPFWFSYRELVGHKERVQLNLEVKNSHSLIFMCTVLPLVDL